MHKNDQPENLLGEAKKRWSRADDPIRKRQPEYAFGSLAEYKYKTKVELNDRSPGPAYFPNAGSVLEKAPEFPFESLASRIYEEKIINQSKSPGPVYKPNYDSVATSRTKNGYMGTLASRDYSHRKETSSKSPGPVYNPKKNSTSNQPPPKAYTISRKFQAQEDKFLATVPAANQYNPKTEQVLKSRNRGGYISTLASRKYHYKNKEAASPGPVYKPKKGCTSTRPAAKSASFGKRLKYFDQIEKEKMTAGPGSYCPEIIPRFKRKKKRKKT